MITQTMVQPSHWVEGGVKIQQVRGLNLFKFTEELQIRLEMLLEQKKEDCLTSEEATELAGITS